MQPRPDLLDSRSPSGIEVFQITSEAIPSSHIYMEAQVFASDSSRFLLHRSAHPHGSDPADPEHRYLVCDLRDKGNLRPITGEAGATAPSVSPDGRHVYYFVDETRVDGGRLTLRRVGMDGSGRETILVLDRPLAGTSFRPSRPYPLSTISSEGKRLALSCFLGDGKTAGAPWGLMVFDLESLAVNLILQGPSWCNVHPQYSRSPDMDHCRDLLVQENHGNVCDARGAFLKLTGGEGADIHVIRDDGTGLRDLPWGRDGNEFCQGHQCWRGRSEWAITSTSTRVPSEHQLIESLPVPASADHLGIGTPRGRRNDLSRDFPEPHFSHFATDIDGRRFITDASPFDREAGLYLAEFGTPGEASLGKWTYLLSPGSSCTKQAHIHPFLSPDGSTGFFNSDETGILQAYAIFGLDTL